MVIGDLGESKALYEFQKRDIPVSLPFNQNLPYDMIIDCCGNLYKVQVKTKSRMNDKGILKFEVSQSAYKNKSVFNSNGTVPYSKEDVDLFFLYNVESDTCMLLRYEDLNGKMNFLARFKNNPPINNQICGINYVEDYSIDRTFERMGYCIV